jgi:torulene dioxygenase
MVAAEDLWPNQAGFDTDYEKHDPVDLIVKGTIPYYAAGVLCAYPTPR